MREPSAKAWPAVAAARLPPPRRRVSMAELSDVNEWEGLDIEGEPAGMPSEAISITECLISGVSFSALSMDGARLRDVVFEQCDLSALRLHEAALNRVEFRSCRMSGLQAPAAELRDVQFSDSKIDGANFRMSTLDRVRFTDCMLQSADFYSMKATMVRLFDCELTGADFSRASAAGTRLHGSVVDGVRGADALAGAVIDPTQVVPFALSLIAALRVRIDDDRQDR